MNNQDAVITLLVKILAEMKQITFLLETITRPKSDV